jgi:pimeloyl-ACP methyl ester carboxylesterase
MQKRASEPEAEDRTSRRLERDGRVLGYAEYGDPGGDPLIALHGTPGSRLMFALADAGARARGLRLIAPERPGCGFSTFEARTNLRDGTDDIEALADALGFERFALIGVSGGCAHAIAAAAAMPDRIVLMALVSPAAPIADFGSAPLMSRWHNFVFRSLPHWRRGPETVFSLMRFMVRHLPRTAIKGIRRRAPRSDRAILAREAAGANLIEALEDGLRQGVRGAAQDFRLLCAPWGVNFADVTVPTVVWQGTDDHIVPPRAAFRLAEALPNCRLDVIHDAGHYWVFDHFDEVLDAAEAALNA